MASEATYAQLASAAYQDNGHPVGWTRLDIPLASDAINSGYYGAAFQDNLTGEIVIAHRGTEPNKMTDLKADFQMGVSQLPDQYQFARNFYDQVANANKGALISTTGHSLGGSLAQLLAAEKNLNAVTFNPYGTRDLIPALNNCYPGLNLDLNATYSNITNHQTALDGVSRLPGSSQLGDMQTHVAPSEGLAGFVTAMTRNPALAAATAFYWSHSIDRFTNEIYDNSLAGLKRGQIYFPPLPSPDFGSHFRGLPGPRRSIRRPMICATASANLTFPVNCPRFTDSPINSHSPDGIASSRKT